MIPTLPALMFDYPRPAYGRGALRAGPHSSSFLLPVEFRGRDGKINDGVEPPFSGDVDVDGVKDEDVWYLHTRIAGGHDGNGTNYIVYELTELSLGGGDPAMFEIAVADGDEDLISVEPLNLTGNVTPIKITGGASGLNLIEEATIELRLKSSGQKVAEMKVLVMPPLDNLKLNYYEVDDPRTSIDDMQLPIQAGAMAAESQERFGQATLDFGWVAAPKLTMEYLETDSNSGILEDFLDADVESLSHIYSTFGNLRKNSLTGDVVAFFFHAVRPGTMYYPEINSILMDHDAWVPVGEGGASYPYGGAYNLTPETVQQEDALGRTASIGRVFTHELGHNLIIGPLSPQRRAIGELELPGNAMLDGRFWNGGHDVGPSPPDTQHLMDNTGFVLGKWLRHEDWEMAYEEAKRTIQAR